MTELTTELSSDLKIRRGSCSPRLLSNHADELEVSQLDLDSRPIHANSLGLSAGIRLAVDPTDHTGVYLARAVDHGGLERLRDALLDHPGGPQLLADRPGDRPAHGDYAALRALPEHSLGGAYARMLEAKDLEPTSFNDRPRTPDDLAFVAQRARHTHDIWHVVTGLDTACRRDRAASVQLRSARAERLTSARNLRRVAV